MTEVKSLPAATRSCSGSPALPKRGRSFSLRRQRNQLEVLYRTLRARLGPIREDGDVERLADPVDEAQRIGRQVTADSLRARDREQFDAVRLALEALAEGTYGICRGCDVPIAPKRLERTPEARLCKQCQELLEREEQELAY